jgi:hypothetical protein
MNACNAQVIGLVGHAVSPDLESKSQKKPPGDLGDRPGGLSFG